MRRTLAVAPLLLTVLVAGCNDSSPQNASAGTEPSPSVSSPAAPSPRGTTAISEQQFCDNIVAVFASHPKGEKTADPLTELMAEGVPAEMSAEAKGGVQVIIDNSGKLQDPKAIAETYRALTPADRESINALITYVVSACGTDILKGLVALLPEAVPDELKSLSPEDLPSELREMLPSELPSSLEGIIPQELAEMIPEEWLSLIPEEYRDAFESAEPTPTA